MNLSSLRNSLGSYELPHYYEASNTLRFAGQARQQPAVNPASLNSQVQRQVPSNAQSAVGGRLSFNA